MRRHGSPAQRERFSSKRIWALSRPHFAGDEVAAAVIHGMWVQMKGPEIRKRWNLTEKQYAAAVRRIRRLPQRKGGSRGD